MLVVQAAGRNSRVWVQQGRQEVKTQWCLSNAKLEIQLTYHSVYSSGSSGSAVALHRAGQKAGGRWWPWWRALRSKDLLIGESPKINCSQL